MRVAYFIISMYLVLPYIGLYTVSVPILNVYSLSINSVYELRQAYPLYLVCFLATFLLAFVLCFGTSTPRKEVVLSDAQMQRLRIFITVFLAIALVVVFLLVGKDIMSGKTHRGAVRVSFGGLGFLYKTYVQFWVPTALAMSGIAYRISATGRGNYKFPLLHFLLCISTLSMMGYKSGIIVGILPFLFIVVSLLSLRKQALFGVTLVVVLIYYSAIIMNSDNALASAQYLAIRGTEGTAWGLIATWELFEDPNPGAWLSLLPVFGPRITAMLLDIDPGSIEYLMLGSGQYVTYLVHPDPSIVLAGETNLTITLAGEAVYLMGHNAFWLLAFPVGFATGFICNLLRSAIRRQELLWAPLLAVMITNIVLPLLNSGGLVSLFSAFNLFYVLATFGFIKIMQLIAAD